MLVRMLVVKMRMAARGLMMHESCVLARQQRRLLLCSSALGLLGSEKTNALLISSLGGLFSSEGSLALFHGTSHVAVLPAICKEAVSQKHRDGNR